MTHAASMLEASGDSVGANQIQDRMREEIMAMPLEEALPIVVRMAHPSVCWVNALSPGDPCTACGQHRSERAPLNGWHQILDAVTGRLPWPAYCPCIDEYCVASVHCCPGSVR
jgi:hypothetical protein